MVDADAEAESGEETPERPDDQEVYEAASHLLKHGIEQGRMLPIGETDYVIAPVGTKAGRYAILTPEREELDLIRLSGEHTWSARQLAVWIYSTIKFGLLWEREEEESPTDAVPDMKGWH